MSKKVAGAIADLRTTEKNHRELGVEITKAWGGLVYPMDLLSFAVLNRSLCLMHGFCDLLEKKNFLAAAPLLRLQLDNLLRYRAAWLVENPHNFVVEVFKGTKIRNLTDRTGVKMTDRYLNESMASEYPELKEVYSHTSGYVHLSDKHFASMMTKSSDEILTMKISGSDAYVLESTYLEAIATFMKITEVLFRHLEGWRVSKENPARPDTETRIRK